MSKPWEHSPDIFNSEAQFNNWFRGELNRIAMDSPIKRSYLKSKRYKGINSKGKSAWRWDCEICNEPFGQVSAVRKEKMPKLTFGEDLGNWFEKHLCSEEDMMLLCSSCKKTYQHSKSLGVSAEKSVNVRRTNSWLMKTTLDNQRSYLKFKGFEDKDISTRNARKVAFMETLEDTAEPTFTEIIRREG